MRGSDVMADGSGTRLGVVEHVQRRSACVFAAWALRQRFLLRVRCLLPLPTVEREPHGLPPLSVDERVTNKNFFETKI